MKAKKIVLTILIVILSLPAWANYFKYYNQGVKYMELGDYISAEPHLIHALKSKPDFVDGMWALVKLYSTKQEWPEAIKYCKMLIENDPKDVAIYLTLSDIYVRLARYKEAASTIRKVYDFEPNNTSAKLIEGDILKKQGSYEAAVKVYKAAAAADKKLALKAYKSIATIYATKLDQLKNAQVYYKKALAIKKEHKMLVLLAYTYFKTRDWANGVSTLAKVKESSLSTDDIGWLGFGYKKTGNTVKAIYYYELLYKKDSKNQKAAFELSELYKKKGDSSNANKYLEIAKSMDSVDYSAAYRLGYQLLKQDKFKEAIGQFKKSISAKNNFYGSWYALGFCEYKLGNKTAAVRGFQKASELKPSYTASFLYLGIIYDESKNYEEAIKAYLKALSYAPNDESLWEYLAGDYFELGQYSNAAAAFEKVVKINPKNKDAWYNLSQTYQNLDKPNLAAEALERSK
ncbi:tetratricopeptide repeat protein [bacterium]|nr:tetratricopeptide repeat protein [bacterium]